MVVNGILFGVKTHSRFAGIMKLLRVTSHNIIQYISECINKSVELFSKMFSNYMFDVVFVTFIYSFIYPLLYQQKFVYNTFDCVYAMS